MVMRLHLNFNTGKSLLGKLGSETAQPLISLPGWCDSEGSFPGAHPGIPKPQPRPTDSGSCAALPFSHSKEHSLYVCQSVSVLQED